MRFIDKFLKKREPIKPVEPVLQEWRDGSRCLPYMFRPARKMDAPLLVIFHGNGSNKGPSRFQAEDYNVLCPLDRYGHKSNGCWFLGEHRNFFLLKMIADLIASVGKNSNGQIYFWGSSMGGYAAIIYGLLFGARAVFCHLPQTNLRDSHWYQKNRPFIELIFDHKEHLYRDIPALLQAHNSIFPLFFLSFNRFDRPFYNDENLEPVRNTLEKLGKNYFLLIHPQEGHAIYQTVAEHVAYFDIYKSEIDKYHAMQSGEKPA